MSDKFAAVGRRFPRIDAVEKVMGKTKFATDLRIPGMVYGKVLRSPHAHAKILSIDTSKAEQLPGVIAVITGEDIPNNQGVLGITIADQSVLEEREVRYIGDAVAAVAATTEDIAEQALELIDVEYEPLPAVFDPHEALKADAPRVHMKATDNIASTRGVVKGDVEQGFRNADFVFEDQFQVQPVEQAPAERESAIVSFEPGGNVTVWAKTQAPYMERVILARALGIPQHRIRVIAPPLGGAFGACCAIRVLYICAALARKVGGGTPVKLTSNREEEFICSTIRHPAVISLKTGVKKDGTIVSRYCRFLQENGAYTDYGDLVTQWVGESFAGIYKTDHLKYEGILVYTNRPYGGPYRGFGDPQLQFALEQHMDKMTESLGIDPVEFRLKNAVESGYVMPNGVPLKSCGLRECITKVAEEVGWKNRRQRIKVGRKVRGVGIACGQHGCGWRAGFDTFLWRTGFRTPEECYRFNPKSPYIRVDEAGKVRWRQGFDSLKLYDSDPSTCVLRVNDDGTINLQIGEVDHGQGALTTMAIIVSEELGVKLEDIKVSFGDTDAGAFGLGTYASRVTTIGGRAVLDAAKKAKAIIFKHASNMLEASPDSLVARDGKVFIRDDPERFVTFADAAFQAYASRDGGHVIVEGYYDAEDSVIPDAETGQGSVSVANLFFAQAIEVEVDTETGEVEVKRIFAAKDAGRIINPVGAEGQVQGAVSQGLGYALSEDIVMEKGRVLNPNFLKYVTPSAVDMPPLDIHFAETYEPAGPYGAKGLGEPALVPVAPAIANAVHDATGVRIYSLPITPEKILHGLKRSKT